MLLKILFSLCIPGFFFFFEKPFIFILHHPVPHVIVKLVYCNDVFIYGWKLELKDWKGMISAYSF